MAEELVNVVTNLMDSGQYKAVSDIPQDNNYRGLFKEHCGSLIPMLLNKIDSSPLGFSPEKDQAIATLFKMMVEEANHLKDILIIFAQQLEVVGTVERARIFFLMSILPQTVDKIPMNEKASSFDICFKSFSAFLARVPPISKAPGGGYQYNGINVACIAFIYSHLPNFLARFVDQFSGSQENQDIRNTIIGFLISLFGKPLIHIDFADDRDYATLGMKPSIVTLIKQLHRLEPDFMSFINHLELCQNNQPTRNSPDTPGISWQAQQDRVNLTSLSGFCYILFSKVFDIPGYMVPHLNENAIHNGLIAVNHLLTFNNHRPRSKGIKLGMLLLSCLQNPLQINILQTPNGVYAGIFNKLLSLSKDVKNDVIQKSALEIINVFINTFDEEGRQYLIGLKSTGVPLDGNVPGASNVPSVQDVNNSNNINDRIITLLSCGQYNTNKFIEAVKIPFDPKYSEDFSKTCLDLIPSILKLLDVNTLFDTPALHSACSELLSTIMIKSPPRDFVVKLNKSLETADNLGQVVAILTYLQSVLRNMPIANKGLILQQAFTSLNVYINSIPHPERGPDGSEKNLYDVNVLHIDTLYRVLPKFYTPFIDDLTSSSDSQNIKEIVTAFLISLFGESFLNIDYPIHDTKAALIKQCSNIVKLICKLEPNLSIFVDQLVTCYKEQKLATEIASDEQSPYNDRKLVNLGSLSGFCFVLLSGDFDIPSDILPMLYDNDITIHKALISAYHLLTYEEYGPLDKGLEIAFKLLGRLPKNLPCSLLKSPEEVHLDLFRRLFQVIKLNAKYKDIVDSTSQLVGEFHNSFDLDGRQLLLTVMMENTSGVSTGQ